MATPQAGAVHAPILEVAVSGLLARALFTVTERGVPDLLGGGPLGSAEIAGRTDAHPAAMHQVLRALAGGRERTGEEYRARLAGVGLELTRMVPTASAVSVVEAVRGGD